jgi:hypothetical protein
MEQFEPGKTISFRLPSDTPIHVSKYLNKRKKKLGRKFSSEIAPIFIEAISQKALDTSNTDQVTIPLPKGLTSEQKEWINHPNTKTLISQLLYQVVSNNSAPFDFNQISDNNDKADTKSFKATNTIQNFAQKTFLNFDDDDDE